MAAIHCCIGNILAARSMTTSAGRYRGVERHAGVQKGVRARGGTWARGGSLWPPLPLLLYLLLPLGGASAAALHPAAPPLQSTPPYTITRLQDGDVFSAPESHCPGPCAATAGGNAIALQQSPCSCQCPPALPVFRDDLLICVDDIQECSLLPFSNGDALNKIPFVFLPLRGQIVFPSAEISFPGNSSPVCVVAGARFWARQKWLDMRDTDKESPFRLLNDNGRTMLQWQGGQALRRSMEGRLIIVQLTCKDADGGGSGSGAETEGGFFSPCVALRVAGTLMAYAVMPEVSFSASSSGGTSASGHGDAASSAAATSWGAGWLVGAAGALLAAIYVLVALLCARSRRRKEASLASSSATSTGVPKSHRDDAAECASDETSCCSESGQSSLSDGPCGGPAGGPSPPPAAASPPPCSTPPPASWPNPRRVTVQVHGSDPCWDACGGGVERLPEEGVSIVETPELSPRDAWAREGWSLETAPAPPFARRKLYFNPAYFEPDLLLAPPAAAIEFLSKIREVMSIAKHKLAAKKFTPTLPRIAEEAPSSGRSKSSRCSGCPGCTARTPAPSLPLLQPNASPCPACEPVVLSKQLTIRKWLEAVRADAESADAEGAAVAEVLEKQADDNNNELRTLPKHARPAVNRHLMDAVIKELVVQRGLEGKVSTPRRPGTPSSDEAPKSAADDDYEVIVLAKPSASPVPPTSTSTLVEGYSLVSEVYVNDNYSFGSTPASPSLSATSAVSVTSAASVDSASVASAPSGRIHYSERPGRLTIELDDPPESRVPVPSDSESFEPDTLDRKTVGRLQLRVIPTDPEDGDIFTDSLERPPHQHAHELRPAGSFRGCRSANVWPALFNLPAEVPPRTTQSLNGSHHSDTDENSTVSSRRSVRSAQPTRNRQRPRQRHLRRQRCPSPPTLTRKLPRPPAPPPPPSPPRPTSETPLLPTPPRPPKPASCARPPLPPRNTGPPPQKTVPNGEVNSNRRHRPLPPPPPAPEPQRSDLPITKITVESSDSSDYEEFYSMPTPTSGCIKGQFILQSASATNSPLPRRRSSSGGNRVLADLAGELERPSSEGKDLVRHLHDERMSDSVKRSWRKLVGRSSSPNMMNGTDGRQQKPHDSGYLSTDSGDSKRRAGVISGSETDESLCDGASESGGESVATDSFFFGGDGVADSRRRQATLVP